jgi:hypothetical protein
MSTDVLVEEEREMARGKGKEEKETVAVADVEGLEMSGFAYKTAGKLLYYLCVLFSFGIVGLVNRWSVPTLPLLPLLPLPPPPPPPPSFLLLMSLPSGTRLCGCPSRVGRVGCTVLTSL